MFSYLELRWLLPGHPMYFVKARKYEYHSVVEHGTHCSALQGEATPAQPLPPGQALVTSHHGINLISPLN